MTVRVPTEWPGAMVPVLVLSSLPVPTLRVPVPLMVLPVPVLLMSLLLEISCEPAARKSSVPEFTKVPAALASVSVPALPMFRVP